MDLTKAPSLDLTARAEGGYLDKLGPAPAVWSPINAYLVQLIPRTRCRVPGRSAIPSRWAARKPGRRRAVPCPRICDGARRHGGHRDPIVLAMDLQDYHLRDEGPQAT